MPPRHYFVLDVFTDRVLAGNPLAVVLDSEGLDDTAMQAIAREFNLSETVFVLPPDKPQHRARLRIFTPGHELPFAGHPTVGTAVLLAHLDQQNPGRPADFILEEEVGPITCEVRPTVPAHATFRIPVLPVNAGPAPTDAALAAVLGLGVEEIGCGPHRPSRWGAPTPFTFIPVAGLEAIRRCRLDRAIARDVLGPLGPVQVYVYTTEAETPFGEVHARMFAPGMGIEEDPATGSAAASFAGLWLQTEHLHDGQHKVTIEQGFEMGRPSLIELGINAAAGALKSATIGGTALIVAEGRLFA